VPSETAGPATSWLLATGDQGARIVVWDLQRRLPRSVCQSTAWTALALVFDLPGTTLASGGWGGVQLWDVATGQLLLRALGASQGGCRALAIDRSGERLAHGGDPGAGEARLGTWKIDPQRGIKTLRGLASSPRKVWFSRDSSRVAALTDNWHLGVWDLGTSRLLHVFETPVGVFADNAGGCFDASGARLGFATGNEACLFDVSIGAVVQRWHLAAGLSDQVQFDPGDRLLLLRRERISEQRWSVWKLYHLQVSGKLHLLHEQKDMSRTAHGLALLAGGDRFLVWDGRPTLVPGGETTGPLTSPQRLVW